MADATAPTTAPSPKKVSKQKAKKPRTAPVHPKVSEMVITAITSLKERGGSSLQAIKKYIAANYKLDVERMNPFIKKYLRSAVNSGILTQTKGKGATGSFKLSAQKSKEKVVKKPKKKEGTTTKKSKAPSKPKKVAEKKAKTAAKKPKAKAKPKKVAKPAKKPAASKPKAPKKAKAAPKKAASKKVAGKK